MPDPYKVRLHWSENFRPSEIKYKDSAPGAYCDEFIYCFINEKMNNIVYIGQAYGQNVYERIRQHETLPKVVNKYGKISIKVAVVVPQNLSKITKPLINCIENALSCEIKPEFNQKSFSRYDQNRDIEITNFGKYAPFPRKIDTTTWELC